MKIDTFPQVHTHIMHIVIITVQLLQISYEVNRETNSGTLCDFEPDDATT